MRAGYAGRGLVYLVVAGFGFWSVVQGGEAEGTQDVMERLDGGWSTFILLLIALGMFAYFIWRIVDAIWDLEAYGSGGKGIVARLGMCVTGLAHLGIGVLAVTALISSAGSSGSGSGSGSSGILSDIMAAPGGRWAVGIAGLLTIAAGVYYIVKAVKEKYREHLRANRFTMDFNWALKAGVAAQGVVVGIIGLLITLAALQHDPSQAGGVGSAFDWLYAQPYGRVLVGLLCLGLLGFSLFCFVNAAYRIVPKAADENIESVAIRARSKAKQMTS
ncbi:DUF1206 domain-containing protein [Pseudoroseicyclus sp. CLL3-39]|uniref:DUF1206 domain-containing protein n=2 Tax=Pseudoroseicyclus tamaricis TaxID=2705421 RepID=A0A6B2JRZ1_9RHOB|nr:DUF1206 domain-containing protein [Pseudoroseicyclus tamaricis]